MQRRNFIKTSAAAGSLAALFPAFSFTQDKQKYFSEDQVKNVRSHIIPITKEERTKRIALAQKLMSENNIDALLVEGGTSLNYFTGIDWWRSERLFAMLLPKNGEPSFIAPKFEEGRAQEQTGSAKLFTWQENESPYELIQKMLKENNLLTSNFAIEESTRYFVSENIQKTAPSLHVINANAVTAGCRSVKTAPEIDLMQLANDVTLMVYRAAITFLKEGMTEHQLATKINELFAEFGIEGYALVLFGKASAYPHGLKQETKLQEGDVVLIDGGCTVEGYESDVTRTTVFGKASDKVKTVWRTVHKAQSAALKAAKPGVPAEQIDAAARKVIEDADYGPGFKFFTHRLGHGIGMDGHEWYYLVPGSKRPVQTGNMFSNEPGIYIMGEFGIRLEDEMLITENGARLLLPQQVSLEKV